MKDGHLFASGWTSSILERRKPLDLQRNESPKITLILWKPHVFLNELYIYIYTLYIYIYI